MAQIKITQTSNADMNIGIPKTNNMKLYTREQMIEAFNYGQNPKGFDWIGDMIDSLKPIELPSDEEIDNVALDFAKKYRATTYEISALIIGAKWMRDKIQGGEK